MALAEPATACSFPPELSGNLTLNLKDVTVREAPRRHPGNLRLKVQDCRKSHHHPDHPFQSRIYQINYLASRRQGAMTDMRVTPSSPSVVNPNGSSGVVPGRQHHIHQPDGPGGDGPPERRTAGGLSVSNTDASRVRTSSDNDFWHDLRTALTTIVGGEGSSVIVSPMSGVVLVKARPQELRAVETYLKATQLMVVETPSHAGSQDRRSSPQRLASRPASTGPSSAATTSASPPASRPRGRR